MYEVFVSAVFAAVEAAGNSVLPACRVVYTSDNDPYMHIS